MGDSRSVEVGKTSKYSVNSYDVNTILAWITSGEIAIPEIQRPFVWDASKVRDLMDSLYQGYPIGYLIAWKNPEVRLKDGSLSEGKKVLIDGQQRVTALTAAVLGWKVVDSDYRRVHIRIAFHPIKEQFEVQNPAIRKSSEWIHDISEVVSGKRRLMRMVREYCEKNPEADEERIEAAVENLRSVVNKPIGLIELAHDLDIETVTEIFVRINSQGVVLSQADFAMSKIASNEMYNGPVLRKTIDYFCHLAVAPEYYNEILENDKEFSGTDYFRKMAWLKDEKDDLYDPDYTALLRVAFSAVFDRGKLSTLLSLLSGRNFETRTYDEEIARDAFARLEEGVLKFINETNFKRFLMIVRSAGFISSDLLRSMNAVNFAYTLFLRLRDSGEDAQQIERYVRKWLAMSLLTGRYSGSFESQFETDIKNIASLGFPAYLAQVEEARLSDAFWNAELVQRLNTSSLSAPYFSVFLASQVFFKDRGFLSREITVADLITYRGDIHHLFPKEYLKRHGLRRGDYNQIANYVYMQSETNIRIGNKPPQEYFRSLIEQVRGGEQLYGGIDSEDRLRENMHAHCIPDSIFDGNVDTYQDFLADRRKLMAARMRKYYEAL